MVQNVFEDSASSCPDNIIEEHLRKIAEVKTIPEIMTEKGPKTTQLMSNLTNVIQVKKGRFEDMENRYMETKETISKLIAENDKLHQSYSEGFHSLLFTHTFLFFSSKTILLWTYSIRTLVLIRDECNEV